ncbi:MAG: hypothetical protein IKP62_06840 [Salinivirgaceae bacterium]|nr:hypothetical protein [Salinivirgaceae bacterium]
MIGSAVLRGQYVEVRDERGNQLCSKYVGSDGQLMGYTGSSFSVKRGQYVEVYDEKGNQLSSNYVG